jgi:hypothetical protein
MEPSGRRPLQTATPTMVARAGLPQWGQTKVLSSGASVAIDPCPRVSSSEVGLVAAAESGLPAGP